MQSYRSYQRSCRKTTPLSYLALYFSCCLLLTRAVEGYKTTKSTSRITPKIDDSRGAHRPKPSAFMLKASSSTPFKIDLPDQFAETQSKLPWVDIYVLDINSLNEAADLSLDTFFKPRVTLNSEGMRGLEKSIAENVIGAFTRFERGDAWLSNWVGFRNRGDMASEALIIAAMDNRKENNNSPLVGLVEISVEEPNGKLPPSLKWFPTPMPKIMDRSYQTYLSNLSVRSDRRRLGLGRYLCEIGEWVAKTKWGKEEMYLHMEKDNDSAARLYMGMGYRYSEKGLSVKERIDLNMDKIDYYSRQL